MMSLRVMTEQVELLYCASTRVLERTTGRAYAYACCCIRVLVAVRRAHALCRTICICMFCLQHNKISRCSASCAQDQRQADLWDLQTTHNVGQTVERIVLVDSCESLRGHVLIKNIHIRKTIQQTARICASS